MNAHFVEKKFPMAVDHLPPLHDTNPPSWFVRLWQILGVIDMPNTPRIWGWNPSVITLLLFIGGILLSAGYYVGRQDKTIESLEQKAASAEKKAGDAIVIASSDRPEATSTSTPKEKK